MAGGIPIVRARYLRTLTDVLDERGVGYGAWLDAVHIPRTLLEHPDAFMPRHQIYAFGTLATRESGIGDLTFVAGQRMGVSEMGGAGRAICAAPTLHRALEAACRSLRDESSKFCLFCEDALDGIRFCRGRIRTDLRTRTVVELYDLALMVNIVRLALGHDWCPEEAALQTASPTELEDAALFPSTRMSFGAANTWLYVPATLLERPIHEPLGSARRRRELQPAPNGLVDSLIAVLSAHPPDAMPTIDRLAEMTGWSLRTLQRRLAEEPTTYWDLLGLCQRSAAEALLRQREAPIAEIASKLGYKDAGSFTRAFRRWTGTCPRAYRAG